MIRFFIFSHLIIFLTTADGAAISQRNVFKNNDQIRTIFLTAPDSPFDPKYFQFNPFVPNDYAVLEDKMVDSHGTIYSAVYHTGKFGLRTTTTNENSHQHIILAGDSNMFGVGVNEEETLPARLAQKLPHIKVINLGLGGVGPNSHLFFLQNYSLKKVVGGALKGMMIYDFHHHLIDRVIGSKLFLSWSKRAPRYIWDEGKLVYAGTFESDPVAWFYMFLNKLPFSNTLFPNLPRISQSHILLTAKVLAEIKKEYLKQTDQKNRFVVTFNPAYTAKRAPENLRELQKDLQNEGVETAVFHGEEIKLLPIIKGEYHQNPTAHENYSKMLMQKLKLTDK